MIRSVCVRACVRAPSSAASSQTVILSHWSVIVQILFEHGRWPLLSPTMMDLSSLGKNCESTRSSLLSFAALTGGLQMLDISRVCVVYWGADTANCCRVIRRRQLVVTSTPLVTAASVRLPGDLA